MKVIEKHGPYHPTAEPNQSWAELPELGPYKYENGATFIGQYKYSKRHGEGKQVWQDGSCYEGQWKNNKTNGKGRYFYLLIFIKTTK